jgi:ketosteroid isomerase-like protein
MNHDDDRLADRLAIHELRARYNHFYDNKDLEAFLSIFTEDGLLQLGPAGWAKGKEELRAHLGGPMAAADFAAHFTTDEMTEFTGLDTARGTSRFAVHTGRNPAIEGAGTYHDTYRRVDGAWKLSSRTIEFFYFGPRAVSFPDRPAVPPPPEGALPPDATPR